MSTTTGNKQRRRINPINLRSVSFSWLVVKFNGKCVYNSGAGSFLISFSFVLVSFSGICTWTSICASHIITTGLSISNELSSYVKWCARYLELSVNQYPISHIPALLIVCLMFINQYLDHLLVILSQFRMCSAF